MNPDSIKKKKLKWGMKTLDITDFGGTIGGSKETYGIIVPRHMWHISNMLVADYRTGEEYPSAFDKQQYRLIRLEKFWINVLRRIRLDVGDNIRVALDPDDNHIVYVDFEYKKRKEDANIRTKELESAKEYAAEIVRKAEDARQKVEDATRRLEEAIRGIE